MAKEITAKVIKTAKSEFPLYIEKKKKEGNKIKILESPYHKGLLNVRSAIEVNGRKQRLWFDPKVKKWRTA